MHVQLRACGGMAAYAVMFLINIAWQIILVGKQ